MDDKVSTAKLPDFHPAVFADIDAKIAYLLENHVPAETIDRFLKGVEEAMTKIMANPTTWSFAKRSKVTRKVQLRRFRMTAFYQIQTNGIPIILELCGAGQLPRWKTRAPKSN